MDLDFSLQKKIMTGSAIQNNTINGGSRGLERCLRSIPAEPVKSSQPTYFLFVFHFSDKMYLLYASTIEKLAPRKLRSVVYCHIIY